MTTVTELWRMAERIAGQLERGTFTGRTVDEVIVDGCEVPVMDARDSVRPVMDVCSGGSVELWHSHRGEVMSSGEVRLSPAAMGGLIRWGERSREINERGMSALRGREVVR